MSRRIHTPDKYDTAIALLTAYCEAEQSWEIGLAWKDGPVWDQPGAHPAACLFRDAGSSDEIQAVGCITQVASCQADACTPELTAMIRADSRVPKSHHECTPDRLYVMAEWQRRIDEMGLRRCADPSR